MKEQLEHLIIEMLERGLLFKEATKEFEKQFILKGLEKHGDNRTQTAKALGIHRNTLQKKILSFNHSGPQKKVSRPKNRLTR